MLQCWSQNWNDVIFAPAQTYRVAVTERVATVAPWREIPWWKPQKGWRKDWNETQPCLKEPTWYQNTSVVFWAWTWTPSIFNLELLQLIQSNFCPTPFLYLLKTTLHVDFWSWNSFLKTQNHIDLCSCPLSFTFSTCWIHFGVPGSQGCFWVEGRVQPWTGC